MSELDRIRTDIAFLRQIEGDAKHTVYCEPHRVDELRAAVERQGWAHILTVVGSPACPAGQLLVADTGALEAVQRQAMQRMTSRPFRL